VLQPVETREINLYNEVAALNILLLMSKHKLNLNLIRSCDKRAIESLYNKLFPQICGWITLNSGTREDAEDIFHDALLTILIKQDTKDLRLNCHFFTYFTSICRHKWFQILYHRRKVFKESLADIHDYPEDFHETKEAEDLENKKYRIFITALNEMDDFSRTIIEASLNGKTNEEIALEFGFKNIQAVADKKKNCKKRLIQILHKYVEYKEILNEVY
jgi:RNA polymerase sigma factor (sigma-70 family)